MLPQGLMSNPTAAYPGNEPPRATPASADLLELRVRRLEDAVAELQDTTALEERVVGKVADRFRQEQPLPDMSPAGEVPSAFSMPVALLPAPVARGPWGLLDAFGEARTLVRMFLDRRYRVSWTVWLVLFVAAVLIVLSWLIVAAVWIVGPWLDKAADLIVAFVAFKVLSREAARYRHAVAGLPPYRRR